VPQPDPPTLTALFLFSRIPNWRHKRYEALQVVLRSLRTLQRMQGARRLGTVEHICLNFITLAAGKDVFVQALAVVMGFNDGKSQTASAYWTQHFRGNRARRLLSKHDLPLPADLLGAGSTARLLRRGSKKQELKPQSGRFAIPTRTVEACSHGQKGAVQN
jgi:hypothetical protein